MYVDLVYSYLSSIQEKQLLHDRQSHARVLQSGVR